MNKSYSPNAPREIVLKNLQTLKNKNATIPREGINRRLNNNDLKTELQWLTRPEDRTSGARKQKKFAAN